MTGRRDPFDKTETPTPVQPPSLYDSLRVAAPRKRKRQWEKQQQSRKVVYRGIDPKLALKVKAIADDLLVPSGEVACAVLDYALRSYERGDFDLHPRPNPERMRMTLFPRSDSSHSINRPQRTSKQKQPEALWKVITTWRGYSASGGAQGVGEGTTRAVVASSIGILLVDYANQLRTEQGLSAREAIERAGPVRPRWPGRPPGRPAGR